MPYETLIHEVGDDHVASVMINRPERMNSWNNLMCAEFARLWCEIRVDAQIHAVVLRTAEGDGLVRSRVRHRGQIRRRRRRVDHGHNDGVRARGPLIVGDRKLYRVNPHRLREAKRLRIAKGVPILGPSVGHDGATRISGTGAIEGHHLHAISVRIFDGLIGSGVCYWCLIGCDRNNGHVACG